MTLRILLLSCFMLIAWHLSAQITITQQHMPKANDTFKCENVLNPLAYANQVAQDGANQFWVFTPVNAAVKSMVEYKSSLKTPYAFFFFNTVGQKVADSIGLSQFKLEDIYQFYSTKSSSYSIEGLGFRISLAPLPLAGNYQIEDKVYQFPLNYGDRDSTPFKVKVSIPLVGSYSQSGYRITQVVGFGKVRVVDDTMECLKVRSDIIGADTIETQLGKFGFPTHKVEYKWLTQEYRHPVVEITGNEVAGQFVPTQTRYMDLPSRPGGGGGTTLVPTPVYIDYPLVYPCPAKDELYKSRIVESIEAYSMNGSKQEIRWEENKGYINWNSGVYVLHITKTDGSTEVVKLVVADTY